MKITEEYFEKCVGSKPIQDDLERCNCPKAGQPMHLSCGWNKKLNKPVFMVGREEGEEENG